MKNAFTNIIKPAILLIFFQISLIGCNQSPDGEKFMRAMVAGDIETVENFLADFPVYWASAIPTRFTKTNNGYEISRREDGDLAIGTPKNGAYFDASLHPLAFAAVTNAELFISLNEKITPFRGVGLVLTWKGGGRTIVLEEDTVDNHLVEALIAATAIGSIQRAKMLIGLGVDVNGKLARTSTFDILPKGSTALHAVGLGGAEIGRILIEAGAEVNAIDEKQFTPLGRTISISDDTGLAEYLVSTEGQFHTPEKGAEAMIEAIENGRSTDLISFIVDLGIDLNAARMKSPLLSAAENKRLDVAKLLLDAGAEPDFREPFTNNTPYMHSVVSGSSEFADLIKSRLSKRQVFEESLWIAYVTALNNADGNAYSPRDWIDSLAYGGTTGTVMTVYSEEATEKASMPYFSSFEETLRDLTSSSIQVEYLIEAPLAERLPNSDITNKLGYAKSEEYTFFSDNTFLYTKIRTDEYADGRWGLDAKGDIELQWETVPIRARKAVTGGRYFQDSNPIDFEEYELMGPSKLSESLLNTRRLLLLPRIYAVGATSSLADRRGYLYQPEQAFDGDPKTAWNEDSEGDGTGEVLWIEFDRGILIDQLQIMAGYFDPQYFRLNNRAKRMTIRIYYSSDFVVTRTVNPADKMIPLIFRAPSTTRFVSRIEFQIDEVFKGSEWNDLAISEIAFSYRGKEIKLGRMPE